MYLKYCILKCRFKVTLAHTLRWNIRKYLYLLLRFSAQIPESSTSCVQFHVPSTQFKSVLWNWLNFRPKMTWNIIFWSIQMNFGAKIWEIFVTWFELNILQVSGVEWLETVQPKHQVHFIKMWKQVLTARVLHVLYSILFYSLW